jgi:hypothetical protein
MKILIASTPATGHLNPLLAIARILMAEGHEIAFLSGTFSAVASKPSGRNSTPFPRGRTSICGISTRWLPN